MADDSRSISVAVIIYSDQEQLSGEKGIHLAYRSRLLPATRGEVKANENSQEQREINTSFLARLLVFFTLL